MFGNNIFANLNRGQLNNPLVRPGAGAVNNIFGNAFANKPLVREQAEVMRLGRKGQQEQTNSKQVYDKLPVFKPLYSKISLFPLERQKAICPLTITSHNKSGHGSVNDTRMGPTINGIIFGEGARVNRTCDLCTLDNCPGHPSYIDFKQWVYNPISIKEVIKILTCVCNSCGGLLINDQEFKAQGFGKISQKKRLKKMEDYCKKGPVLCFRNHGGVECCPNPTYISSQAKTTGVIKAVVSNKLNKRLVKSEARIEITADRVAAILNSISEADARKLGFIAGVKPVSILLRGLICPPNAVRPVTMSDGTTKPNIITTLLCELKKKIDTGDGKQNDLYMILYKLMIKQKLPGATKSKAKPRAGEDVTIMNIIQGKDGHIRSNMSGKRNNNAGRTVANPHDPLDFGEVGLPSLWANILVKSVKVQAYNIDYLYDLLAKGQIVNLIRNSVGKRESINVNTKLEIGDTVERCLVEGDVVCDNRQPTLHRYSFLQYYVKFVNALTHNNHGSVLSYKNCDYDGDENNTWVPEKPEAEAEAEQIVSVIENEMSSGKNAPGVGLILHGIAGAYILTDEMFIYDELFAELLKMIKYNDQLNTLYTRLVKYGVNPRSGRALLSALFPEDFDYRHKDFEIKEGIVLNPPMVNGKVKESARATKKVVGAENRSIIQEMFKFYGREGKNYVKRFLSDAPRVIGRFMDEYGLTVCLDDCIFVRTNEDGTESDLAEELVKPIIMKTEAELESIGGKKADALAEEFRQMRINEVVDNAKIGGELLVEKLFKPENNFAVICSIKVGDVEVGSGAKGNVGNVGQMGASAAEQFVKGARPEHQLTSGTRSSICRDPGDLSARANGYVPESYMRGSTPEGHWFIMKATREGLLGTANQTSEIGTIAKRMGKTQENKVIGNDLSVRNTIGNMLAPVHNGGYKTEAMVMTNSSTGQTNFIDVTSLADNLNRKSGFIRKELNKGISDGLLEYTKMVDKNDKILGSFPNIATFVPSSNKFNSVPAVQNVNTRLGRYERSAIIQNRAVQIDEGRPPKIDITGMTRASEIAAAEYHAGLLGNMSIVRKYANGSGGYEFIPANSDFIWG